MKYYIDADANKLNSKKRTFQLESGGKKPHRNNYVIFEKCCPFIGIQTFSTWGFSTNARFWYQHFPRDENQNMLQIISINFPHFTSLRILPFVHFI